MAKTKTGTKKTSTRKTTTKTAAKKTAKKTAKKKTAGKTKSSKTTRKTKSRSKSTSESKKKSKRTAQTSADQLVAAVAEAEPATKSSSPAQKSKITREVGFGFGILDDDDAPPRAVELEPVLEPPEPVAAKAEAPTESKSSVTEAARRTGEGEETGRRRRRRGKKKTAANEKAEAEPVQAERSEPATKEKTEEPKDAPTGKRRRRRGRRRGERKESEAASGVVAESRASAEGLVVEADTAVEQAQRVVEKLDAAEQTALAPPPAFPEEDQDVDDDVFEDEDDVEIEEEEEEEDEREPRATSGPKIPAGAADQVMLINVADGDECRIAILADGRLEELYSERATSTSNVGNIYKGVVTNVESSIQAAFVDFGHPHQHGFLHISDLHPKYFSKSKSEPEVVGKKMPRRHRPPIQNCLKKGQEIIVQVIKEGIGTKGPTLSSYVSLPGRLLVMMPGMEQLGVSRKIEDEEERRKLRDLLGQLSLPKDMGFIVRTAGIDRTKRDLQRDLNYLTRLWRRVSQRINKEPAPAELYKESDLVIRTVRDVYDSNLKKIIVDSPQVADRVREFLSFASPKAQDVVETYRGNDPMFHHYSIEPEIDKLYLRRVPLPCGGSLIIESTEALVAIDVNSGRFRIPENAEETAFRVNMEAVDEIARQLRLRDLGGLIICDLIDMTQDKHRRAVERKLTEALKKHKERAKILRISRFGILEMTRQRQRPSFTKSVFRECQHCHGSGRLKTVESASLDVMRQIRLVSHRDGIHIIDVNVSPSVANDLQNRKRVQLADLERNGELKIRVHATAGFSDEHAEFVCTDSRGREIRPFGTEFNGNGTSRGSKDARGPSRSGGRGRRQGRRRGSRRGKGEVGAGR